MTFNTQRTSKRKGKPLNSYQLAHSQRNMAKGTLTAAWSMIRHQWWQGYCVPKYTEETLEKMGIINALLYEIVGNWEVNCPRPKKEK